MDMYTGLYKSIVHLISYLILNTKEKCTEEVHVPLLIKETGDEEKIKL